VGLAGHCGVGCAVSQSQEAGQCGHHSEKSKFSEVGQMALDLHHLLGELHPMNNLLEYWWWRRQGARYSQCHFTFRSR
jgi:hypothetical protein